MAMQTEYGRDPGHVIDRIVLRGALSETSHLSEWAQRLAARYCIDDELQFAIYLCLEEVVSNIIRHGYAPDHADPVTIEFSRPREGQLVFTIEDFAPPFNPLLAPEMPLIGAGGELPIGGRGIRLLRVFAHTLEHERTVAGNRLRIGFTDARAQVPQPQCASL
jgi:anti-sigma regulatory factor (Ser/Thr protein kinase)